MTFRTYSGDRTEAGDYGKLHDFLVESGNTEYTYARIALVEPVCTIPECRRMGLAREAVFEGLRRVRAMGAKIAVVGSDQPFYYALGFVPHSNGTVWKPAEQ